MKTALKNSLLLLFGLVTWNISAQTFSFNQSITPTGIISYGNDASGSVTPVSDNIFIYSDPANSYDLAGGNYQFSAGAVYLYSLSTDSLFINEQKLLSPDRFTDEHFGSAAAIENEVIAIGASGSHLDENQTNFFYWAGAVYIGRKNSSGQWFVSQKLVGTYRNTEDYFGRSLSMSGDLLAVGSLTHDMDSAGNFIENAGSAFLYRKDVNENYSLISHLTASDRRNGDFFGCSVFFLDSMNLFIGAEYGGSSGAGVVYYYERSSSGQWIEKQKIAALNEETSSLFGNFISGSGEFISITASNDRLDNSGQNSKQECGAVYIFKKDIKGVWKQHQRLVAVKRESNMKFGHSLAMEGRVLVVGAAGDSYDENNADSVYRAGSAYVYYLNDNNTWQFIQKLTDDIRMHGDRFGGSVSLYNNILAVSVYGNKPNQPKANIYFGTNPFVGFKPMNNNKNLDLTLFPNPTSGIFILNTNGRQLDRMKMYDVNGRLVHEENLIGRESAEVQLPDNILNGLYLVRIEYSGEVVNKKLLVNGR